MMITGLSISDDRTQPNAGLFDYISPSRLNTWLACPLKFKIRYIDGIKEPPSPSLFLGKRVHAGLEFFYRQLQRGEEVEPDDISRHMLETWDEAVATEAITFASADEEDSLQRQALDLVQKYLGQRERDEGVPLAVESRFTCPLLDPETNEDLGISLFGIVDLLLETANGTVIVDFKTSAKSAAPLDVTHEIQLSCYAYLFRDAFGQPERELQIRSLIKTKVPKVETHTYPARNDAHFRRLFAVIRAYLDDLHSNRFVYRPSWMCSMCSFRDTHCRAWQG